MRKKIRVLLDGMHFADSEYEALENSSDYISWVGQESFHVWRHEVAYVCDSPSSIAARPLDERGEDPETQEHAVSVVESEWETPGKEYDELFEDMVGSASACGIGGFTFEVQNEGRWGEVLPRGLRYDQIMWDPAVKSPLSRRCRWLLLKYRMTRAESLERCSGARARWSASVVSKLRSDDGYDPAAFDAGETTPVPSTHAGTSEQDWSEEDEITFYLLYERVVGDTKAEEADDGYTDLPEEMRYMACPCGWRSERQGSRTDDREYPETMLCPECGQVSTRIDGTQAVDRVLEYPDGRLTVVAPYGGQERFVYEGDWEVKCPNYPIVFLSRFRHPTRPYGPSLADLNWNQIAVDMVMRTALERMMVSASYWMLPADSLEDAWGQPWQFTTDNGFAMYYRSTAAPSVQMLEGTGIPQSWAPVYAQARNALVDKTGIADFGLGPDQSRNIPASSAAIQVQQQEIPTAHYKRMAQRAKGYAYDLAYAYLQAVYPDERISRVKDVDGTERVVRVRPSALPPYQFYCSDAPEFKALEQDKREAFNMVVQMIEARPWALDMAESVFHLPHSVVQKGKDSYAKFLRGQAEAAAGGGMGGPPTADAAPAGQPMQEQQPPSAMVERLLQSMSPQQ